MGRGSWLEVVAQKAEQSVRNNHAIGAIDKASARGMFSSKRNNTALMTVTLQSRLAVAGQSAATTVVGLPLHRARPNAGSTGPPQLDCADTR